MKLIFFTKFLTGLTAKEVGETAKRLGVDGLDLAIRKGQCVNPDNVAEALPEAMKIWKEMGLSVPLASMETRQTDPRDAGVRRLFEACGKAGIREIKIGYWKWSPNQAYWPTVETIRADLKLFEALGRDCGCRTLIHNHSGANYGGNASQIMQLARGFDPKFIGAYLDPAHLAICGEAVDMALDIVRDYLAMIAVKNCRWTSTVKDGVANWKTEWCLLNEGVVNWPRVIELLKKRGYDGWLSVHGEYSGPEDREAVLANVVKDVPFLRKFL
ncbi:MAG: sugar phosphate isomerase/epimerase [Candidatus Sumerlaeia bacterium]|nr:sugar phosphate isomerase/epimerase [Candidatus Sumerlaeia bacterium]